MKHLYVYPLAAPLKEIEVLARKKAKPYPKPDKEKAA
jgi:hypothetical protein